MQVNDATEEEIRSALAQAWSDFHIFRKISFAQRREFLYAIADELSLQADSLVQVSASETNLPGDRLLSEINRTIFQLKSYGDHAASGSWLDARIDTADPNRVPMKPDIRKTMVPLGPVAVFGASNFPFAYSTAGGDTASAFAAGCPVIVKAHPAHPMTSEKVAACIRSAIHRKQLPAGIFAHIHGGSYAVGKLIVQDPHVKAVGFTGSMQGGRALFDWAAQRRDPIPVFAEMGSINPVYLFPGKLAQSAEQIARNYAGSITLGIGQFCTNPGLLIAIKSDSLERFKSALKDALKSFEGGRMLHQGIAKAYQEKREKALAQEDVSTLVAPGEAEGAAAIAVTSSSDFNRNHVLHQEVFGPYSLIIECEDLNEMMQVALHMDGQLTTTVMALESELVDNRHLLELIQDNCGRLIFNGVPTGVEVCLSMQHGGPYPSCTDSRFTSVGADAIKRFIRPIAFQNYPNSLLPDELKDENPMQFVRTINNISSRDIVTRNSN